MLNTRTAVILRELMGVEASVTSEEIGAVIGVTSRTVRNDIKELNILLSDYGAEIKSVRGAGFRLMVHDQTKFLKFLQLNFQKDGFNEGEIPTTPEDRVQYLVKRLLLAENYLKMEDAAEELFVSKSTIQYDFRHVRNIFKKYGIFLESRPNYGMKLKGPEFKLRFCMSEFIFNQYSGNHPDIANLDSSILSREDMLIIRDIIVKQINEHHITLSDIGLTNLVIHIAIACKRIQNNNFVYWVPEELKEVEKQKEYEVAGKIIQLLEKELEVSFPAGEIAYVAVHLMGTKLVTYMDAKGSDYQSVIDNKTHQLTARIIETVDKELRLGIRTDKELNMSLYLHLKPAINRFKYGMNIRNPMLNEIKLNYPVAFEAGIIAGRVIEKETGVEMNEHEAGYLALHIGAAIERRKITNRPKRCLVVCATGIGSSRLLSYKLQEKFGDKIEVAGTTEYYKLKEQPLKDIDFIISTIPISEPFPVPIIEVNTFLGNNDFEKIQHVFSGPENIDIEYTRKELVFLQQKLDSKKEVLHFICNRLQEIGLVGDQFLNSVLEREALSPTSFGNMTAIPHPVDPQTDSTFWAICTLQKPIKWGEQFVQFVCLLSVKKSSKEDLQKMYRLLGKIIDDSAKVQKLIKCKTYEEFVHVFVRF
ncbi:BglG family transcription antiterminator [Domibacillus indicus]|uniref:BglG family transcription antiterminator n=1 Tax=Domibacillus indicus TaxID=1437523 RepID=UPI000617CB57|nr:BglG family transcription antiterminator [Domibacillus indicus]